MIKVALLKLNEPNINGRVYTKESFVNIPNEIFLVNSPDDTVPVSHGTAKNIRIEDNKLVADIVIDDKAMQLLFDSKFSVYVTSGIGKIDETTHTITEYELRSVYPTTHLNTVKAMLEINEELKD